MTIPSLISIATLVVLGKGSSANTVKFEGAGGEGVLAFTEWKAKKKKRNVVWLLCNQDATNLAYRYHRVLCDIDWWEYTWCDLQTCVVGPRYVSQKLCLILGTSISYVHEIITGLNLV